MLLFWGKKKKLVGSRVLQGINQEQMASYLVPGQDFEGGYDLVGRVRVGGLAGHEVDEGLEGDDAHPVGIHHAHDARELVLPLVVENRNCHAQESG